jgi:hypothetical protein
VPGLRRILPEPNFHKAKSNVTNIYFIKFQLWQKMALANLQTSRELMRASRPVTS